jgi:hypothetical protein
VRQVDALVAPPEDFHTFPKEDSFADLSNHSDDSAELARSWVFSFAGKDQVVWSFVSDSFELVARSGRGEDRFKLPWLRGALKLPRSIVHFYLALFPVAY